MGGHANYYLIIENLILLKEEFHRISKEKYQPLINELSRYEVYHNSDNEHLPDHKTLAIRLKYSQSKMNALIKDLLKELMDGFHNSPLEIKNHVHQFMIHIPWDEAQKIQNKRYLEESRQQFLYLEMILPVTPRLGEEIEIPFVKESGKYYRGYVHEIKHKITGTTQEIELDIHPMDDFYYKWVKMAEEYEKRKRWLASIRNM
jgi:hypothetical protein